nr:hypothetical protein Iba_chr02cCG7870 [Ipomoea batatas]GMD37302.1 hypothetical protein Iba_chr09eCG8050 [Ipomoea batatas]
MSEKKTSLYLNNLIVELLTFIKTAFELFNANSIHLSVCPVNKINVSTLLQIIEYSYAMLNHIFKTFLTHKYIPNTKHLSQYHHYSQLQPRSYRLAVSQMADGVSRLHVPAQTTFLFLRKSISTDLPYGQRRCCWRGRDGSELASAVVGRRG